MTISGEYTESFIDLLSRTILQTKHFLCSAWLLVFSCENELPFLRINKGVWFWFRLVALTFVEKNWFGHWGTLSSLRPLMAWHIVCVDSSITSALWATPHLMAVREASAAQWLLFEARDSTPFMVLLCPSLSNNKNNKQKENNGTYLWDWCSLGSAWAWRPSLVATTSTR